MPHIHRPQREGLDEKRESFQFSLGAFPFLLEALPLHPSSNGRKRMYALGLNHSRPADNYQSRKVGSKGNARPYLARRSQSSCLYFRANAPMPPHHKEPRQRISPPKYLQYAPKDALHERHHHPPLGTHRSPRQHHSCRVQIPRQYPECDAPRLRHLKARPPFRVQRRTP